MKIKCHIKSKTIWLQPGINEIRGHRLRELKPLLGDGPLLPTVQGPDGIPLERYMTYDFRVGEECLVIYVSPRRWKKGEDDEI